MNLCILSLCSFILCLSPNSIPATIKFVFHPWTKSQVVSFYSMCFHISYNNKIDLHSCISLDNFTNSDIWIIKILVLISWLVVMIQKWKHVIKMHLLLQKHCCLFKGWNHISHLNESVKAHLSENWHHSHLTLKFHSGKGQLGFFLACYHIWVTVILLTLFAGPLNVREPYL